MALRIYITMKIPGPRHHRFWRSGRPWGAQFCKTEKPRHVYPPLGADIFDSGPKSVQNRANTCPKPAPNQPKPVQNRPKTSQNRSQTGQKPKYLLPGGYIRRRGRIYRHTYNHSIIFNVSCLAHDPPAHREAGPWQGGVSNTFIDQVRGCISIHRSWGHGCHQTLLNFIRFGAMDVTKPYKFIRFGAMDVTKPYKLIRFGAMDVTKPQKLGFGAMDGPIVNRRRPRCPRLAYPE
jgi:hypothetical protein